MKLTLLLLSTSAISSHASLRGSLEKDTVQGWGQLKCMFEAFSNEEKCAESLNDDGQPCSYCIMQGGGRGSGLCVDPEVAPQMEQLNPSISCSSGDVLLPLELEEEPEKVEGWGQLKCMFEAFSDEEKCAEATNGDGAKCSYCVVDDGNGDKAGLCVDPDIAPGMEQMNPAISCNIDSFEEEEEEEVEEDSESESVDGWGQLKCMFEAFSNKEKCGESLNDEGEPCSYCVMQGGGEDSGLCVDPEVAPQMQQLNPSISCTTDVSEDEEEELGFDYHDFKCSIKALTNPSICSKTKTDDGEEHCEFCTIDGPFGQQGLCVSPAHAAALKGFNPAVKCDSRNESSISLAMK